MTQTLQGTTVLVTRPAHQAASLIEPLESRGAIVYALPAIKIVEPDSWVELDRVIAERADFDWIVFSSINAVEAFFNRVGRYSNSVTWPKIASMGSGTAQAISLRLKGPNLVPTSNIAEDLADALGDVSGKRILLPRGNLGRRELPDRLRMRGAEVTEVVAYHIVRPEITGPLPESCPNFIALTSSSGAVGTFRTLQDKGKFAWMTDSKLACIGPSTATTVRDLGFEPCLVAQEFSIPGLVDAIEREVVASE